MTQSSPSQSALHSKANLSLVWLSALGILLSIINELSNLPWDTPGWAILTRTLHIWLGAGALSYVLFHYRIGRWLLWLWILTAIPVIATDSSQEWVDTMIELKSSSHSWSLVNEDLTKDYYNTFEERGINLAPILVAAWFIILSRRKAFPCILLPQDEFKRTNITCSALLGASLLGIIGYTSYLLTAPALIWGAGSQKMEFYYKDQRLGTTLLRLDAKLMDTIGLDSTQPPAQWARVRDYQSLSPIGIELTDGVSTARIDIHTTDFEHGQLNVETPWGRRNGALIHKKTSPHPNTYTVRPLINSDFKMQLEAPTETIKTNQPFTLIAQIGTWRTTPTFATTSIRIKFIALAPNRPGNKHSGIYHRKLEHLEGLEKLREGHVTLPITLNAPPEPGIYSVQIHEIWLYDAAGDYAEPIRTMGASSHTQIEVH